MVSICSACDYVESATQKTANERRVTLISFHSFPRDEELLKKWLDALGRENWRPSKNSKLCSRHFEDNSYETSGWSSLPKLRRDAVPTIFNSPAQLNLQEKSTVKVEESPTATPILSELVIRLGSDAKTAEAEPVKVEIAEEESTTPPRNKKRRKCYLGDFKNDESDPWNNDAVKFALEAKNIIDKQNKQIRRLKQNNGRLEKRITILMALIADLKDQMTD